MAKVTTEEYNNALRYAETYRQIMYMGSTVCVTWQDSHNDTVFGAIGASSRNINHQFMINLGYKHSSADFANANWPMGIKDTLHIKKGQTATKRFKVPGHLQMWSAIGTILPPAKADAAVPSRWVGEQTGQTITEADINDDILITIDNLPFPGTGTLTANTNIAFQIKTYHHFGLRNPSSLA